MQKRRLGNTTIEVSVIGLGTVKFGRNQGVKYPEKFELPSDQSLEILLNEARALGVNLLDTAPAYGTSEERLGKLLRGAPRHEWVIATKVGETFVDGKSFFDFSAPAIQQSIENSLRRLQTDYLDIVLIHSNGDDIKLIEEEKVFATLQQLKQAGKILSMGMSTKTVAGGMRTIDLADVVMVTFNPAQQEERAVIAYAAEKQKGILIKKAFASGHLQQLGLRDPIKESLQFIFQEAGVTSVIVGTINPQHLREIVKAVEK